MEAYKQQIHGSMEAAEPWKYSRNTVLQVVALSCKHMLKYAFKHTQTNRLLHASAVHVQAEV